MARHHSGVKPPQVLGAGSEAIAFDLGRGRVARVELNRLTEEAIQGPVAGLIPTQARRGMGRIDIRVVPKAESVLATELKRGGISGGRESEIVAGLRGRLKKSGYDLTDPHPGNIGKVGGRWQVLDPGAIEPQISKATAAIPPRPTQLMLPFGSGHAGLTESIHGRSIGTISKCSDQRLRLSRITPGVKIPRVPQPGWNLGTIRARASGHGWA